MSLRVVLRLQSEPENMAGNGREPFGGVRLIGVDLVCLRMVLAWNLDPNANNAARAREPSEAVLVPAAEHEKLKA